MMLTWNRIYRKASAKYKPIIFILGIATGTLLLFRESTPVFTLNQDGRQVCARFGDGDLEVRTCRHNLTWTGRKFHDINNIYYIQPDCSKFVDANLIILVFSKSQETALRQAIRETYAKPNNFVGYDVVHLFVVGVDSVDESLEGGLRRENRSHNDILQVPTRDGHFSHSHKTLGVLRWLEQCACSATYILKVNSNTLPNIFHIQEHLERNSKSDTIYCINNASLVERNPNKKNYVHSKEFYNVSYPRHCMGGSYLTSMTAAMTLFQTAQKHEVFRLELPYITGLLREVSCLTIKPLDAGVLDVYNHMNVLPSDWDKIFMVYFNQMNIDNYMTYWENMQYYYSKHGL